MSIYQGTNLVAGSFIPAMANIIDALYPVGSIYIGITSTCPLAAITGTWTLKSSGKVLQGSDSNHAAGTTIAAGLPNITGKIMNVEYQCTSTPPSSTGALFNTTKQGKGEGNGNYYYGDLQINASRSNSIYGSSTTVQPPAYVVNIWERTA